ncbi:MAG: tyrosine-type recombinase/integrase [Bdellovibrionaceae bacterium]|nr:tyrosine-type recombinase/integrase [Pseudobdellovibrionaceae bacterium]NUM59078.1 tyrosine-type recombinase/integrase [Pseudobdellovibrionaceae bacterium]
MIEAIYTSVNLRDELKQSPFIPFIEKFAMEHFSQGYKIPIIRGKLTIIIKFIRWAAYKSVTPKNLKKHHIEKFKLELPPRANQIGHGAKLGFSRFIEIIEKNCGRQLAEKYLGRFQGCKKINAETLVFEKYMKDDRGLTDTSIVRFKTTIRQFLTFIFPKSNFNPKKITAADILDFLKERGKYFNDRTLRCDGSAIKCYMRFLFGNGLTRTDLSHAVPQFSIWRNQNVIHTITEEEMLKMLSSCDRDEAVGVRDFAILLLLMRYGLRPIEIIKLKLHDICWDEKKIVVQGKGKKSVFPLESDAEEALRRYIKNARPESKDNQVFIRAKAPFICFSQSGAISSVVRQALDRCHLNPKISGARLLRYSAASNILNKGGTLQEVSELLRHTSINTSVRYTRLDMTRLKLVALAWPNTWEDAV